VAAFARHDLRAQPMVGGKDAVKARQVHARARDQGSQSRQEIQRFENNVGGAVAVRGLKRSLHLDFFQLLNSKSLDCLNVGRDKCESKTSSVAALYDCGLGDRETYSVWDSPGIEVLKWTRSFFAGFV
jgi:hypothetical protein